MRYRLAGVAAILAMFAVALAAVVLASGTDLRPRHHQHEESRSVADLAPGEREAASSTAIDAEGFASHLPLVSIHTDGQPIPGRPVRTASGARAYGEDGTALDELAADGRDTVSVRFALYDCEGRSPELANRLSDEPAFETKAELRIRGHSSAIFEKPSYRVTLTLEDRVTPDPHQVLGMGVEEDWVLHGPYLDKSLVRNYLSYNLFGEILPFTPDVRFVELFLDGGYRGVYVLTETVQVGPDRVAVRPTDRGATQTSFLVLRDWHDDFGADQLAEFAQETYQVTRTGVGVEYPVRRNLTESQRRWIQDELNQLERDLYSYDYDRPRFGYRHHLDVGSFVDYALVNELAMNHDAGLFSTYLHRDLGSGLAIGPVWDFNNAYGNDFEPQAGPEDFVMTAKPLYSMLFRDEGFTERLIARWRELREGPFADGRIEAYVDAVAAYLGSAVERNYAVWGETLDPAWLAAQPDEQRLSPVDRSPASHGEALDDLKGAIADRIAWLDAHVETLRQLSHESAVKAHND